RGLRPSAAVDFAAAPGKGVTATVDGRAVRVGAPARLIADDRARPDLASIEELGGTSVAVLVDGEPAAILAITDRVRDNAEATVESLTAVVGAPPIMMTGDNPTAANRLAERVGIGEVHAGLLPPDKVAAVSDLQAHGHHVTVVGDGINDAPALAAADAGIAMGGTGSDLALATADAVVVRDDLATIPAAIRLSRRARKVVIANLAIAAVIITGLVAWDLIGTLPLPLGVAGHEGSTVLVGLNGLRLLRASAWRPDA
ncbi:MAG TPA: HAD-IC family P-type ATPase, partial [Stackebrandtia sp.]|uniref:HAD-IC family P-type ATPase n=1 Tax=Stackebrandtia sp. TaxID=2023065 RepID=UPI002D5AFDDE